MAAPTFVQAGTGQVWTTGAAVAATIAGTTAGNLIILQALIDDVNTVTVAQASFSNLEDLAGTDGQFTTLSAGGGSGSDNQVGAAFTASQHLFVGRSLGGTVSVSCSTTGDDLYFRLYEFTNVNTGTTVSAILENTTAGNVDRVSGTSTTIADVSVTTTGVDRLAVNFIAVNDDNALGSFTGETGGDWTLAADFGSATGTDGEIGLQTAAMAAAATIDGGTFVMAASDAWGVMGFALIGTTVTSAEAIIHMAPHIPT